MAFKLTEEGLEKNIKAGMVLNLSESISDSFVEIQESFVERFQEPDIKMKVGVLAQTAIDIIVERT